MRACIAVLHDAVHEEVNGTGSERSACAQWSNRSHASRGRREVEFPGSIGNVCHALAIGEHGVVERLDLVADLVRSPSKEHCRCAVHMMHPRPDTGVRFGPVAAVLRCSGRPRRPDTAHPVNFCSQRFDHELMQAAR